MAHHRHRGADERLCVIPTSQLTATGIWHEEPNPDTDWCSVSLMARLTAFASHTTFALIEDGEALSRLRKNFEVYSRSDTARQ